MGDELKLNSLCFNRINAFQRHIDITSFSLILSKRIHFSSYKRGEIKEIINKKKYDLSRLEKSFTGISALQ